MGRVNEQRDLVGNVATAPYTCRYINCLQTYKLPADILRYKIVIPTFFLVAVRYEIMMIETEK